MPKVTYIEFSGKAHTIEVKSGQSVMEGAVRNNIPGILAECGGACACATCHVYIDPDWFARIGPRTAAEVDMLDFANDVQDTSRLSCQVKVSDALDGLVLKMPRKQG
jgi:2Fe-2S ferredoxin